MSSNTKMTSLLSSLAFSSGDTHVLALAETHLDDTSWQLRTRCWGYTAGYFEKDRSGSGVAFYIQDADASPFWYDCAASLLRPTPATLTTRWLMKVRTSSIWVTLVSRSSICDLTRVVIQPTTVSFTENALITFSLICASSISSSGM